MEITVRTNAKDIAAAMGSLARDVNGFMMAGIGLDWEKKGIEMYQVTTRGWKHQPEFTAKATIGTKQVELKAGTDDKIWNWVNKGTKGPYPIYPKRPGYPLRFNTGYVPHSGPKGAGVMGGYYTGPQVRAMRVMHPGISPRNFDAWVRKNIKEEGVKIATSWLNKLVLRFGSMAGNVAGWRY